MVVGGDYCVFFVVDVEYEFFGFGL